MLSENCTEAYLSGCFLCDAIAWITCLDAVLDNCLPPSIGQKAKGAIVFDELVREGYFVTDSF